MIPPRSIKIREATVGDLAWNDLISYGRRLVAYVASHDAQITAPIHDEPCCLRQPSQQNWYMSDELAGWLNLIEEA